MTYHCLLVTRERCLARLASNNGISSDLVVSTEQEQTVPGFITIQEGHHFMDGMFYIYIL